MLIETRDAKIANLFENCRYFGTNRENIHLYLYFQMDLKDIQINDTQENSLFSL